MTPAKRGFLKVFGLGVPANFPLVTKPRAIAPPCKKMMSQIMLSAARLTHHRMSHNKPRQMGRSREYIINSIVEVLKVLSLVCT